MSHLPSPFLELLLLSMISYGMEYPFGQFRPLVLAVAPLRFLCTPSLPTGGAMWVKEKALALCKCCSEQLKN